MLNVNKASYFPCTVCPMSRQSIVKCVGPEWHCTVCTMLPSPTKINKTAERDGRRDRCCVQCANVVSWQLRMKCCGKIQDWKIFDEKEVIKYKYNLWMRMCRICSTDTVEHHPGGAGPDQSQRSASWIISQIIVTINQFDSLCTKGPK